MKFTKLLLVDFREGIIFRKTNLFMVLLFFLYAISITSYISASGYIGSWGDYLFRCFEGNVPFRSEDFHGKYYKFPIEWLLIMSGGSILSLFYPFKDYQSIEIHLITRADSRVQWWLSKCVWCLLYTSWYFIICCLILGITCLLYGGGLNLKITIDIFQSDFLIEPMAFVLNLEKFTLILILILLTMMTINLIQLTVGMFIHPIAGFLTSISILGLSAVCFSSLAIGNYAMLIRNSWILTNGVSTYHGIVLEIIIIIFCIFLGIRCIKKRDWLS